MLRWAAFGLCVTGVTGLAPTQVNPSDCCNGENCLSSVSLNFPETVYPVTPRFDFNITGSLSDASLVDPKFTAKGSLGLPNHPLGIFGFESNGTACGQQKILVEEGILAVITVNFPPCPWSGDVLVTGHTDIWTTIPAVPMSADNGVSTGFSIELHVSGDVTSTANVLTAGSNASTESLCQQFTDCESCRSVEFCNFCPLDNKCDNGDIHLRTKCRTGKNCVGPKCADDRLECSVLPKPEVMCLSLGVSQPADEGADPTQDLCNLDMTAMPEYPPNPSSNGIDVTMPTVTLDLDMDPSMRWDHIVRPRARQIEQMVDYFADSLLSRNSSLMKLILNTATDKLMQRLPDTYRQEIDGIAKSTGLDVIKIFVYNIMYEVEGLCTSMVSQDVDGHIYHSRNLDFGLFMGDDADTHMWKLTEMLRPLLMNVHVVKGGKSMYNMTHYAGFVGLLTGVKEGGFSLSVDTRFDGHLDQYLVMWLLGKYDGSFLSFKTREVMETELNYTSALDALTHYKSLGPCYIIIGGAQAGEGAVIALGAGKDEAWMVRSLKDELAVGSFFVLQTNYDWPDAPPAFDDRRYPAVDCMQKLGSSNISWSSLWGVMSSNPTRNGLTTYTTLMSAETGHFEAYKQFCTIGPDCVPFLGSGVPLGASLQVPAALLV